MLRKYVGWKSFAFAILTYFGDYIELLNLDFFKTHRMPVSSNGFVQWHDFCFDLLSRSIA